MVESTVRHFPRETITPPGRIYERLDPTASIYAVERACSNNYMTPGAANLLTGLLEFGNVKHFPGGDGLDYDRVYKRLYRTDMADAAMTEIAEKIGPTADVVLAPEHSAIVPAGHLASKLKTPVVKVSKNGKSESPFAASLDSYTGGEQDVLSVAAEYVETLKQLRPKNGQTLEVWIVDEILDTGAMTEALAYLVDLMRESGLNIELKGAVALMEKTYTGARKKIEEKLHIDVLSGLLIDDIGGDMQNGTWIKVPGINEALTFST